MWIFFRWERIRSVRLLRIWSDTETLPERPLVSKPRVCVWHWVESLFNMRQIIRDRSSKTHEYTSKCHRPHFVSSSSSSSSSQGPSSSSSLNGRQRRIEQLVTESPKGHLFCWWQVHHFFFWVVSGFWFIPQITLWILFSNYPYLMVKGGNGKGEGALRKASKLIYLIWEYRVVGCCQFTNSLFLSPAK